jgi:hypothetical protein
LGVPGDQVFGERLPQLLSADPIDEHRPASTMVRNIEQRTMSTCAIEHADALSMSSSARYISNLTISIFSMIFVLLNIISMFIVVVIGSSHVHMFV